MDYDVLYWHWIVFGVALMLLEIVITTFFFLWFGVAALIIGGLLFVAPGISLSWQIFLWTVLSSILAFAWFKYLKPLSIDRTTAGLSREAIVGQTGQVIDAPNGDKRGKLRFPAPILGDDEWMIIANQPLQVGDRVRVVDVSGNALMVEKA
ncbi:NfeD family protein [Pseudomaricurvus alcaniphilus]|uniref:NfeD family protein n=1 Tax=Pseudomaricurvus alcaniphilus TaxID=1166482 RepID=UPI00140BF6D4|nr:NfeD family protein [Pseudomaricurvus alcaniphilus]NHN36104.1 NfeD family protein [Pseudomaricurvus alcaniphilus]